MGLGALGLGSMIVPPVAAGLAAGDAGAAWGEILESGTMFAVIRGTHILSVVAASVLLLIPDRHRSR